MKKLITSILTIVMVMSSISVFAKDYSNYKQKFWDVPKTHWAFEAVSELVDKNVINGYEDGSFKPDRTVNRGEWAKMMVTAANLDISDNSTFHCSDLVNHWSNRYVNAAINYLPSYNDGTYRPDMMITRDAVTASMVKLKGYNIEDVDYSILSQFRDVETIGNYMKAYVAVAVEKGLISGFEDNTFRGQDTLTRAEAATILNRAFQLGDNNIQMDVNNQSFGNNSDISYDGFKPEPTKKPDKEDNKTNVEDKNNTQNEDKDENNKTNKDKEKDNVKDEIKENKKGYKIETLSKVNITPLNGYLSGSMFYTQGKDDLYYYDNDTHDIVKINMISRDKETIENSDTLTIEHDGNEYSNMNVRGIFYDSYVDSICVYGSFKYGENLFEQEAGRFHCIIELNTMNVIDSCYSTHYFGDNLKTFDIDDYNFWGTLKNGDYIASSLNNEYSYLLSRSTYKWGGFNNDTPLYIPFQEFNGDLYYSGKHDKYLYKLNDMNERIGDRISELPFYGLVNNKGYVLVNNAINVHKLTGELVKDIPFDNVELTDGNKIKPENINYILLASSNDDIVFYDTWTNSFRIISENK